MGLNQINRFTHVNGAAIYALDDNGQAESEPSAIDVAITLPALEFETSDVNMMGTLSIVDQTRLGNIQVTASLEADNPQTQKLIGPGLKKWKILWTENVLQPNGLSDVVGFQVNCGGYVTSIPEGSKELGSQAVADYAMNCVSITKTDSNNVVHYDIDRSQSKLRVNGIDYRARINELLG